MMPRKYPRMKICLLISATVLAGCAAPNAEGPPGTEAKHHSRADRAGRATPSEHERVHYYIDKLPDRDYVDSYGGEEHPRPWYTAAEALGEIGKPAIPALIERLDTPDPYELKLALYALMLASQDPVLQAETRGDYLRLDTVLTADTNEVNRRRALDWWQRYRHLWKRSSLPAIKGSSPITIVTDT